MAAPSISAPKQATRKKSHWLVRTLLTFLLAAIVLAVAFYWRPTLIGQTLMRARMWTQGVGSDYVQLGPYRIHYLTAGSGYPLVLVNGLGASSENWGDMIPELKSKGFSIYAPDMLGFGRSDKPDVDYSISLQADVLNQFLESQGLNQFDLVGWSMGGWISMKYAAAHPQKVHRLILLDSAGLIYNAVNAPAFLPKTLPQLSHMMDVLNPNPAPMPAFVARDVLRAMRDQSWIIDRCLRSMGTGKDVMDEHLQELTMPTLLVWGREDLITPLELGNRMAHGIPQSTLFIADGCGHMAPTACANQVVPQMEKFLQ